MKIIIVVQARVASTRLPGKVLLPLLGTSVLLRQIERLRRCESVDGIVVATSTDNIDDAIVTQCVLDGIDVFRGSELDCLDRHYQCGLARNADVIVKIPSDCPLIDPAIVDRVVNYYRENAHKYDYVSNLHPASYPDGNDVEVIPMPILEQAWHNARKSYEREHTTPYIWDNPQQFFCGSVCWESGMDYSMSHRWTLDYDADYHFIVSIYSELYPKKPDFGIHDILNLLDAKPHIAQLNSVYAGVNWYRHNLKDLKTITEHQTHILIGEERYEFQRR